MLRVSSLLTRGSVLRIVGYMVKEVSFYPYGALYGIAVYERVGKFVVLVS